MKQILILILSILVIGCAEQKLDNVDKVKSTEGLVAFWDFNHADEKAWKSYYDENVIDQSFPLYLRQIGDIGRYAEGNWPYSDDKSKLLIDHSGPFQKAVRFNQGYIYGEVPRVEFDDSLLDLKGRQPFTLIAWVKFDGNRHMVAGIWDEGGWDRYAGRRQAALFAGLFNQKGVIAHVSSTGAASYPQSAVDGSQYARIRAIDGKAFENGVWVAIAMSFDPDNNLVKAYLNGVLTEYTVPDPVTEDVMQNEIIPLANPLTFKQALYSPKIFQIKYNGYDFHNTMIKEHILWVNLEDNLVEYSRIGKDDGHKYRLKFDVIGPKESKLIMPINMELFNGDKIDIPFNEKIEFGDKIITKLELFKNEQWRQVGTQIEKIYLPGAPFTFGRALGLDEDGVDHGSEQIYIDGVAVFNRVLPEKELQGLSFIENK